MSADSIQAFAEPREPGGVSGCAQDFSGPHRENFRNGAHVLRYLGSCGVTVELHKDGGNFVAKGDRVGHELTEIIRGEQFQILRTLRRFSRIRRHRLERSLLVALLINPGLVLRECDKRGLKPESFADIRHQHIFWGLREMHLNRKVAIKAITVGLKPNRIFLRADLLRLAEMLSGQVAPGYVYSIAAASQPVDLSAAISEILAGSPAAGVFLFAPVAKMHPGGLPASLSK